MVVMYVLGGMVLLAMLSGSMDDSGLLAVVGGVLGWLAHEVRSLTKRLDAQETKPNESAPSVAKTPKAPVATPPVKQALRDISPVQAKEVSPETPPVKPASSVKPPAVSVTQPSVKQSPATVLAELRAHESTAKAKAPQAEQLSSEPSLAQRFLNFLMHGNLPVRIGVFLLMIGCGTAIKYGYDQGWIQVSMQQRLMGLALFAGAGMVWGWLSRNKNRIFGLSLQGAAISMWLMLLFASHYLYAFLPAATALVGVLLVLGLGVFLAFRQDSMPLMALALLGAYLGSLLVETPNGQPSVLFTFLALLNAAVFVIAWLKPWRLLNSMGFGFTVGLSLFWGVRYFQPELTHVALPFLLLFFVFYVGVAVAYALKDKDYPSHWADFSILMGTPLATLLLDSLLLDGDARTLAIHACLFGLIYVAAAVLSHMRQSHPRATLIFSALAAALFTLAVPLWFSAQATTLIWAMEGLLAWWYGLKTNQRHAVWLGQLMLLLAQGSGVDFVLHELNGTQDEHAHLFTLGGLAAITLTASRVSEKQTDWWPSIFAFCAGVTWWFVTGLYTADDFHWPGSYDTTLLWVASLSCVLACVLHQVLNWSRMLHVVRLSSIIGFTLAILTVALHDGLFTNTQQDILAWGVWLLVHGVGLYLTQDQANKAIQNAAWLALSAVFCMMGSLFLWRGMDALNMGDSWMLLVFAAPIAVWTAAQTWRKPLPVLHAPHASARFQRIMVDAGLILLGVLAFISLFDRVATTPLPYLPVLNVVELFELSILGIFAWRIRRTNASHGLSPETSTQWALWSAAAMVLASAVSIRAVHHYGDVPWNMLAMSSSALLHLTLTSLWAVFGVAAWVLGSKRHNHPLWLTGACIMGVVLLKLLLIDRQYTGNVEGIISFFAVGLLLVGVGKIAPTPPKHSSNVE